jgi:hypothetical protein
LWRPIEPGINLPVGSLKFVDGTCHPPFVSDTELVYPVVGLKSYFTPPFTVR